MRRSAGKAERRLTMKFDKTELSLDSEKCKLTRGLHTTLYLEGLGFWNLQPEYAFMIGGAEAFCKAWALFMKVPFDGDCEAFYKHFDFDIVQKSKELTKLIRDLTNRDIEPVKELSKEGK